MEFEIKEGPLESAILLAGNIPEFDDIYSREEYDKRLKNNSLILLAYNQNQTPIGFKIGYEKNKSVFYSWFGGVIPEYRKQGVAKALATYQENQVRKQGYKAIRMKTKNEFKPMLLFAIKNDFNIINTYMKPNGRKILLEKLLK
jgi:predicted GNAT superfamily acetyltransferase